MHVAIEGQKLCLQTSLMRKKIHLLSERVETRWKQTSESSDLHETSLAIMSKRYLVKTILKTQRGSLPFDSQLLITASVRHTYIQKTVRAWIQLINCSLWIIYSAQKIAIVFCCTRRNFEVISQKLLTNSLMKIEFVERGYKAELERLLKTLDMKCWFKWVLPLTSEPLFPLQLNIAV